MQAYDHKGKTALVTGASSGIGAVFARQLAARGSHLVLVARREDKLRELGQPLATQHGVRVEAVAVDLSRPDASSTLKARLAERGIEVDTLVNNAGFGTHGDLETTPLSRLEEEVRLPGATNTEFFDVVGHPEAAVGAKESPEDRNRGTVISGLANFWMAQSTRFAPRSFVTHLTGRMLSGG